MRTDLRNARISAGLTQQQVAVAIGKDQGTYSRYESGAMAPDKDVALLLAAALGMQVLDVLYPEAPVKTEAA